MEIGPIFRALLHNKTRFFLIVTEIALTLAIVANCLNMIADQRHYLIRPTGIDEENILAVTSEPFAPGFEEEVYLRDSFREDLITLRAMPGVRAASAMSAIPLGGGGSMTGRKPYGSEQDAIGMPTYVVADGVLEALGVELESGRDFIEADFPPDVPVEEDGEPLSERDLLVRSNVLLTRAVADRLFPEGDALGKILGTSDEDTANTVVGIMRRMTCSWPTSSVFDRVMLYPGKPYSSRETHYIVRAEPGMVDSLYTSLEESLLGLNDGRIVTVETLSEIKGDTMQELGAMIKMLGAISILLVVVTSLGIVGLTAFSVTQRTRQIGTRRALGATQWAVLRYFLVENWVTTSIGLGVGLILTYGLNFALAQLADQPMIAFPLVATGMGILWLVGLVSTLVSATRSTKVSPVLATRTI
jgi:putative ABC transport system permease protein